MQSDETEEKKNMISEPLLLSNPSPKGGLRVLPFIIANIAFEKVASYGLSPNMILYLRREYRVEAAKGANIIFLWSAATNFMPILGAFLADSYVGRFGMISFGSLASLLGTIVLWLTSVIPEARPPPCEKSSDSCQSATTLQVLLLYSSFGLLSIGAGGIRSSSLAFGADQLGMRENNAGILESFISWYYVLVATSAMLAMSCIVYIQDAMGWKVGYGVPVVLMTIAALSFFLASPFYVKCKPKESFFTGYAQVIAAAFNKRTIPLSSEQYKHFSTREGPIQAPTDKLRFLNKACIIKNPEEEVTADGRALNPWRLCTVDQVEEVKKLIKIMPIWTTGMIMSVNVAQSSFQVLQASTMDRHIITSSGFEIPAGSLNVFLVTTLAIWVSLYDRVIIPLASKLRGKPVRLRMKQKMGIGILLSSASVSALAIAEKTRRQLAIEKGFQDDPNAVVPMSVMWLLPYLVLCGLAEAFNAIGQNEFYYTQLPKCMSSIASTLFDMGMSVANLLASLIMTVIHSFSQRGGQESWVSSNINKGHYDYYYWLLTSLSLLNFVYYLACSNTYGPCRGEGDTAPEEEDY